MEILTLRHATKVSIIWQLGNGLAMPKIFVYNHATINAQNSISLLHLHQLVCFLILFWSFLVFFQILDNIPGKCDVDTEDAVAKQEAQIATILNLPKGRRH